MLNLEPLIANLVNDVLRALRGVTLDELRELVAIASPPSGRAQASRRGARRAPGRSARPWTTAKRGADTPLAPEGSFVEITDPDRLLAAAMTASPREAPEPPGRSPAGPDEEPPRSTERLTTAAAKVALREGETLARPLGGAGPVVRRVKRV